MNNLVEAKNFDFERVFEVNGKKLYIVSLLETNSSWEIWSEHEPETKELERFFLEEVCGDDEELAMVYAENAEIWRVAPYDLERYQPGKCEAVKVEHKAKGLTIEWDYLGNHYKVAVNEKGLPEWMEYPEASQEEITHWGYPGDFPQFVFDEMKRVEYFCEAITIDNQHLVLRDGKLVEGEVRPGEFSRAKWEMLQIEEISDQRVKKIVIVKNELNGGILERSEVVESLEVKDV